MFSIDRAPNWALYAIFFASGFASLMLQVVWFKQLGFVLGSSTFAVSVTVAAFFLGLSVGSAAGGRLADRVRRPLRTYGLLEVALGVLAVGLTWALSKWAVWIAALQPFLDIESPLRTPVIALVAVMVLAVPTLLMGATLPFLARFVVTTREVLGSRIGMLYGANTLGAALGAFTVGFVLLGVVGVWNSAMVAAGLYGIVGATALALSTGEEPAVPEEDPEEGSSDSAPTRALMLVFGASGFAALGYEIVWFRMLAYGGHQSVFTFSGLLFVYLVGLVLGSIACARWLRTRRDNLAAAFARLQLLLAASATLSLALIGKTSTFKRWLAPLPEALGVPLEVRAFLGFTLTALILFFAVLIVPTTLLGVSFPLASELTIKRLGGLGRRLGALYSLNTLGGVLGSLVTGFVLLPTLGSQGALTVMIALNFFLFAVVVYTQPETRHDRTLRRTGALGLVAIVAALVVLGPDYLLQRQTAFRDATVLDVRENKEATFVVLQYGRPDGPKAQQLVVNGESYANNSPSGRRYMALLGHLPLLLHPDPKSALVTCIGTGTTVGSLTAWEQLETIHAVDLSQTVFDVAPHFVPINHTFYEDPRVRQITADGRHYLLSTSTAFDVLTFEPPPPSDAGIVNLYSEEFYELARGRTADGGVLAQWIPFSQPRPMMPRLLLKAMLDQYPHVSLWMPAMMEGIAIASEQPLRIDEALIAERMRDPEIAADLAAVGVDSPSDVLAMFIADEDALRAYVGDAGRLTDDMPRVEYHNLLPLGAHEVDELERLRTPVHEHMTAPPSDPVALARSQKLIDHLWRLHAAKTRGESDVVQEEREALEAYRDNRYVDHLLGRR